MKKFSIVLVLMVLAVLITGCGPTQSTTSTAFVGGTEGLRTSFLPGNPPDAVFDGGSSSFSIVVKLENVGENSIKANEGYVKINGLDPGTYGVSTFKKNFDSPIDGARKNFDGSVLNGGVATIEFGGLKYTPVISGNLQQTVWADICYKYVSKSVANLCIKQNPELLIADKKICDVEGEKSPQNAGSPIQITSLKENFAGNGKIGITILISHTGNGDNFFDDRATECNDVESNNQRGKVHVLVKPVKLGGKTITPVCSGLSETRGSNEGYLRLFKDSSGKAQYPLYCTVDATSTDSIFEVPIETELTYLYLQHIEKVITIRHVTQ